MKMCGHILMIDFNIKKKNPNDRYLQLTCLIARSCVGVGTNLYVKYKLKTKFCLKMKIINNTYGHKFE